MEIISSVTEPDPVTTIEKGETIYHPEPLANETVYRKKVRKGDKVVADFMIYRTWDFNKDGRVDLVQEYDDQGNLILNAYDFDFDGNVDLVKTLNDLKI